MLMGAFILYDISLHEVQQADLPWRVGSRNRDSRRQGSRKCNCVRTTAEIANDA